MTIIIIRVLVLLTSFVGWFAVVAGAGCQEQLLAIVGSNSSYLTEWIDPDTPSELCIKQLCTSTNFAVCNPSNGAVPKEDLVLVFSDEFEKDGRKFGAGDKDPKWTAMDMYYYPTRDEEIYKPEQVTTRDGSAVIKIEERIATGVTQQPNGDKLKWNKPYASGFMEGWNKFCYTGGYLEASVKLPGDHFFTGFWPALWTMGNLGRAGYMQSTTGFWPYSYNTCGQGSEGQAWSNNMPQLLSACPDSSPERTLWGMAPGVGRGAPEFDVFEVRVHNGNDGTPDNPGPQYSDPKASHTLQMAPLLPEGVHWLDQEFYQAKGLQDGVFFPGFNSKFQTNLNGWWGSLSTEGQPPRPGNVYQDSFSATSYLDKSFYTSFHKFGVDWMPGEYLRWYIDDMFVYEVNKNALLARMNARGSSTGTRLIPLEAVYVIFNVGMSKDFSGWVDFDNLPFPSEMLVDYIRVYQKKDAVNVGCSPPAFPTSQYIACNREKYTAVKGDDAMMTEVCKSGASLHAGRFAGLVAVLAAGLALLSTTLV